MAIKYHRAGLPRITGIMPVYNGISGGYPFLECLVSALPLVDEFIVNDGGSSDGTREILEELVRVSPIPIHLMIYPHRQGKAWEGLDHAIEQMLKEIDSGWVIEVQADELFSPYDRQAILNEIRYADTHSYNSIRQLRPTITQWFHESNYPYRLIRIFRWDPRIRSKWGGDNFYFDGLPEVRPGFTSHYLPPELDSDIKIYNLDNMFPENDIIRAERHYCYYAIGAHDRQLQYKIAQKLRKRKLEPYPVQGLHPALPEFFKPLVGKLRYEPNIKLLDKQWLAHFIGGV